VITTKVSKPLPTHCSTCESKKLSWAYHCLGAPDISDGRHRTGEIAVVVYLGCDECSETVFLESLDLHLVRFSDTLARLSSGQG